MGRDQREQIKGQIDELARLIAQADSIESARERKHAELNQHIARVSVDAFNVEDDGLAAWRVVPLTTQDADLATELAAVRDLQAFSPHERGWLNWLQSTARDAAHAAAPLARMRLFTGRKKLEPAHAAADELPTLVEQATANRIAELLLGLAAADAVQATLTLDQLPDPSLRFGPLIGGKPNGVELIQRDELNRLPNAIAALKALRQVEERHIHAARHAGAGIRDNETRRLLSAIPIEGLRDATDGRLPIKALVTAGVTTVQDVLDQRRSLPRVSGVGQTTANRAIGAATTLEQITRQDTPVRIDVKTRGEETTALLAALRAWSEITRLHVTRQDHQRAAELTELAGAVGTHSQFAVVPLGSVPASRLRESAHALMVVADAATQTSNRDVKVRPDVWEDFLSRPAEYFGMLTELGFETEDTKKTHGDLPDDVIESVRAQELLSGDLTASLRGYQGFAARFALVQEKVIIGDEMGLGKTVEALAVLAHLNQTGERRFIVVCPAAVVTNWIRETTRHTKLRAHRIHGSAEHRRVALRGWSHVGGVAVTTYDLLDSVLGSIRSYIHGDIACAIFDEAHYIKNPKAQRSQAAAALIDSTSRVILMTGTPLENRVIEFRNLAGYVRPSLSLKLNEFDALAFRKQVAPVYLRRNQEDVLLELPDLIEVEEWLPMSPADLSYYMDAVIESNFMAMRRAAMIDPDSTKLARLIELVNEAKANGRRVIVFSYFLDVLANITAALADDVFGPLTGSVPAARRQELIDRFSDAPAGAVLVSQISAGGVGLNIQAASVVVICEPQLKPTAEMQAIARSHRMGQIHTVQVHRLLNENSVDERIVEILGVKRALFEQFARVSDLADATPEATDISETEIARQVVAEERERLLGEGRDEPIEASP